MTRATAIRPTPPPLLAAALLLALTACPRPDLDGLILVELEQA